MYPVILILVLPAIGVAIYLGTVMYLTRKPATLIRVRPEREPGPWTAPELELMPEPIPETDGKSDLAYDGSGLWCEEEDDGVG